MISTDIHTGEMVRDRRMHFNKRGRETGNCLLHPEMMKLCKREWRKQIPRGREIAQRKWEMRNSRCVFTGTPGVLFRRK